MMVFSGLDQKDVACNRGFAIPVDFDPSASLEDYERFLIDFDVRPLVCVADLAGTVERNAAFVESTAFENAIQDV